MFFIQNDSEESHDALRYWNIKDDIVDYFLIMHV